MPQHDDAHLESPEVRKVIVQQFRRQMQDAVDAHQGRLRNQDAIDELKTRQQTLIEENSNLAKAVAKGLKEWREQTPHRADDDWVLASTETNGKNPIWLDMVRRITSSRY